MRIGVISDTHDHLRRTEVAIRCLKERGVEALIHCGDITGPPIVEACAVLTSYYAFGNHDADRVPELRDAISNTSGVCLNWGGIIELAGKRIAVAHGNLTADIDDLLKAKPDYLLRGHSHRKEDRMDGSIRRINPGALVEADVFTVAMIDLTADEVSFIDLPQ